jgi:glycine dehydrogenase
MLIWSAFRSTKRRRKTILQAIAELFGAKAPAETKRALPGKQRELKGFLSQPVFHENRSETEMMRYLRKLADKDLALDRTMIPLGSCTMKLNAAAEMLPVSWPAVANLHPFAPKAQSKGYKSMCDDLERWLAEITGFAAVSLQPNAGSQGEYAGLLAIRRYHASRKQANRNICLIPSSAHGTNPASAAMAGMNVVVVKCLESGDIDMYDMRAKVEQHKDNLAALMITYPSTHGVFEEGVKELTRLIHDNGGQVYLDGANLNAMVGLARPGDIGGDVCHMNLHKTFCIPHGGGGPGVGPIGVAKHLAPFLPGHIDHGSKHPVSAAPFGSASILPITWMYIRMMGPDGLKLATEHAILAANYVASRLGEHFPVLYKGRGGRVAHECILDTRVLKESRRQRRGRRQAPDRLRFPRTDHVMASRWYADGRADRVRAEARTRPVLRCDDRDRQGSAEDRRRLLAEGRQPAGQRTAHCDRNPGRRVDASLQPHGGRLPRFRSRHGGEILAACFAHRQRGRRPQSGLFLPAAKRLRRSG